MTMGTDHFIMQYPNKTWGEVHCKVSFIPSFFHNKSHMTIGVNAKHHNLKYFDDQTELIVPTMCKISNPI